MIGPITEIRADLAMPELVKKKGMFPSRTRRFCTELLKVKPLIRYIKARQDVLGDVVNAVGIRAAESQARSQMTEWEWNADFDCDVWRPLIGWSEDDVIAMHQLHGLRPNPLYLAGARRVGCWPCIHASKAEIRHIAEVDPGRIQQIRDLEADVQAAAEKRYAAKGETFESQGYMRPTFFQAMGAMRTEGGKEGRMVSIDDAVTWSKTSHGGKQIELFASGDRDAGCMRWGLCDTKIDPRWAMAPRGHTPEKRYFHANYNHVSFSMIARDEDHARALVQQWFENCGDGEWQHAREAMDGAAIELVERSPEEASAIYGWDDARDGGKYPLTTFELGALLSSEY